MAVIETRCLDIANWKETKALVEDLGPIDILVNNAGVNVLKPLDDMTEEDFDL